MAFDLQAHRGGLGLVVENTMAAFRHAARLGVTTLECDAHVSADGVPVVLHDRVLDPARVRDTGPAHPEDPLFPYVGAFVCRLTTDQLATLDAGSLTRSEHPGQRAVPGARLPHLAEVLGLAAAYGLRVNVETKLDVLHPEETAPRERFVEAVGAAIAAVGGETWVSVQSFDWTLLRLLREREPRIRRMALVSERTLQRGVPGPSPWLAGPDADDLPDLVDLVVAADVDVHGISPDERVVTPDLLRRAHAAGLVVVPYTVDDPARLAELIAWGVDGVITDYPDRARDAMRAAGLALPPPADCAP